MYNILITDDSSTMRAMIKKVIKLSGVQISNLYEASNGLESLKILSKNWIDLILTDINMPEMDGIEFLKTVKKDELLTSIPVVMITTEGSDAKIEEAFSLGACGFVKKPFTPEEVKKVIIGIVGVPESVNEDESEMDF